MELFHLDHFVIDMIYGKKRFFTSTRDNLLKSAIISIPYPKITKMVTLIFLLKIFIHANKLSLSQSAKKLSGALDSPCSLHSIYVDSAKDCQVKINKKK